MGSDDLFHKRRSKNSKHLKRKGVRREAYKKILIVCEGEKTEPNYFKEIRDCYRLNTVNVEVRGACGADPLSIVYFAKQCFKEASSAGDSYDEIYCVFDKDAHVTYGSALNVLESASPKNTYFLINSVPCFEYWLLLHFVYSARPYTALPTSSSANQVLVELKKYMPGYAK